MEALSEDGCFLASHVCSHPSFGPHDMGVTSDWKHKSYKRHYPDGYEVVWVEDAKTHEGVDAAHKRHLAWTEEAYKERMKVHQEETPPPEGEGQGNVGGVVA